MIGAECTHGVSESPWRYCGAPATWMELATAGVTRLHVWRAGMHETRVEVAQGDATVLNLLCDAHRTRASVPIPHDAERAAPSEYLLKR